MTDKDVEREIKQNQARVRDKEDIGLDENVVRAREGEEENRNIIDEFADVFGGEDESDEQEVEDRHDRDTDHEPED